MLKYLFFTVLSLTIVIVGYGQTNFREGLEATDPIQKDSIFELDDKLKIHQEFLDKAIKENDSLNQLYGYIYLYFDYISAENYDEPENYIFKAKKLAEQSGNKGWQGWVNFRTGILYVRTYNIEQAIQSYKSAIPLCRASGDSLCIGESYEQLCIMNGFQGKNKEAQAYFDLALPLLQKYGKPKNLCTAYANYGSLISMMGDPEKAIPLIEKSMEYCGMINKYDAQASCLNNLGDAYRRLEMYDKSIETYETGIKFSEKHNFGRVLIKNYKGLQVVYDEIGKYKMASEYLTKRYDLKDSLMGLKIQEKISTLEIKFENQKKELKLQKSKIQLLAAKNRINKIWMTLVFLIIVFGLIIWIYYKKRAQLRLELNLHQAQLKQLTQTLINKNAGLKKLEDQIVELSSSETALPISENMDDNLYNQTILTAEDWLVFKSSFEKSHPGFIFKLRKAYPSLSEAEERLFVLLKLNLTRHEIAAILGISPNTVKKTRNRLRKRLDLDINDSLDEFAMKFQA